MKTFFCGLVALGIFGISIQAMAAPDKVLITAQKKRAEPAKGLVSAGGPEAKGAEKMLYDLKLQNQTLADLSKLTIDYVIFVERQKLGTKLGQEDHVDRITGSKTIDVLTNKESQIVSTEEIQLGKQSLTGGYTYVNGGRLKAEDAVVGVWVRVSQNGEVVGEYTNPPTVTKRGWEKK
jgi:hypothetical protein